MYDFRFPGVVAMIEYISSFKSEKSVGNRKQILRRNQNRLGWFVSMTCTTHIRKWRGGSCEYGDAVPLFGLKSELLLYIGGDGARRP